MIGHSCFQTIKEYFLKKCLIVDHSKKVSFKNSTCIPKSGREKQLIKNLKNNKAAGEYQINVKLIKSVGTKMLKAL